MSTLAEKRAAFVRPAGAEELTLATLELAADRVLQKRRDWKHLIPIADVQALLADWRETHAVLPAGPNRWALYNTTYFDTHDFRSYRDHVQARPRRTKVRYRDYDDRGLTFLEVKARQSRGDTHKHRVSVDFRDRSLAAAYALANEHGTLIPTRRSLDVTFWRLSLLHRTRPERVTLDVGLHWWADGSATLNNVAIVEVKSGAAAIHTHSLRPLRRQRHRPSSFSKYCIGLALAEPRVSPAPFTPLLKRIYRLEGQCPLI
jgi:hypothetical protein